MAMLIPPPRAAAVEEADLGSAAKRHMLGQIRVQEGLAALRRPILQVPLSYGPVAIYANVTPEFHKSSTLQLSAPVAAAIFQGNITTWDDPAIVALNPNFT